MQVAEGFIDVHCHILPGLDDGAPSMEDSLRMVAIARADGVAGIVATPHILQGLYENSCEAIGQATSELQLSQDSCQIYQGAEMRITRALVDGVDRNSLQMINGKTHLLLELPSRSVPPLDVMEKIVRNLRAAGVVPLIAHPERNLVLRDTPCYMHRLAIHGALFQVTAMSITNDLGNDVRRSVFRMIRYGLVHVVASDAHDPLKRPPVLSRAFHVICDEFGQGKAEELFMENPLKIINGEGIKKWGATTAAPHRKDIRTAEIVRDSGHCYEPDRVGA